jgi:hypothetical protein
MNLKPLGDRILIKPLANDTQTASGLILMEHRKPETMGEVIAVGTCAHPLKAKAEELGRPAGPARSVTSRIALDFQGAIVDCVGSRRARTAREGRRYRDLPVDRRPRSHPR